MLNTSLANIKLSTVIYNASGCHCYIEKQLLELNDSDSGAVLTKSCTLNSRKGNEKPKYYESELGSINSNGLENSGYYYYKNLSKYFTKPYIISMATLEMDNALKMIEDYNKTFPNGILEVNVSCPNIKNSPQVAYNFEKFEDSLNKIFNLKNLTINIGLKLSPYFDTYHIKKVSEIILKFPVKFITCINSFGNGLIVNSNTLKPVIKPRNGLGGIGGDYCKPIALANVYQFYKHLKDKIQIVGCGGVKNGQDVIEYISCGANAVQIGTHLMKNSPSCFNTINNEIKTILKKRNIKNIMKLHGLSHL